MVGIRPEHLEPTATPEPGPILPVTALHKETLDSDVIVHGLAEDGAEGWPLVAHALPAARPWSAVPMAPAFGSTLSPNRRH
ncbi:MAG: hypothetical protein AAGC57_12355 [Pseudomonadota bacterium]